jgi:adenine deaminase
MSEFIIEGNIVDVVGKRIFKGAITIADGLVKSVEEKDVDSDKYIMPGLVDAHIHVESSMLVPSEFARIAVTHGTVATVSDPHEIANVLGVEGVYYMIDSGEQVPLKFYFGAPSCVPATPFETSGGKLDVPEIEKLLADDRINYLSEMMNFPGVLFDVPDVMAKLEVAKKHNKPIDGHAPGLTGDDAAKYAAAGISTDHECFTLEEALGKIELGMKILIREGSAAKNYNALKSLLKSHNDMVMLCSDDLHPNDLLKGHINLLVKRALKDGFDFFDILTACTVNPKNHYNLDTGLLQTGDKADFIIVDNLQDFNILQTFIDGEKVAENGKAQFGSTAVEKVNKFNTDTKTADDFFVQFTGGKIRVIEIVKGQIVTNEVPLSPNVDNGNIVSDIERDKLKITVVNRYENAKPAIGFIRGFKIKNGAIASSVAHDSHNIVCVGTNDEYIAKAVNIIIKNRGGLAVVDGDNVLELALPVAGIMTDEPGEEVATKYEAIESKVRAMGSRLPAPMMTLSFMALIVIPSLKLSDKGLFDINKFDFVDLAC